MTKRCKRKEEKNLLPFHIIKAASEGDVLAINTVLKHYSNDGRSIRSVSGRIQRAEGRRFQYYGD